MKRKKLTKKQLLIELSKNNKISNTKNAYDLNETGGFVSDRKVSLKKLYKFFWQKNFFLLFVIGNMAT